jgi:hypothetical protein
MLRDTLAFFGDVSPAGALVLLGVGFLTGAAAHEYAAWFFRAMRAGTLFLMTIATELKGHRQANRFGWQTGRILMAVSVVVMLVALCLLFVQQAAYKQCTADFLAYDSQARSARADASAKADLALQAAFGAAAKIIDPAATPTEKDLQDARDLFAASSNVSADYDAAVAKYPYQNFQEECLS